MSRWELIDCRRVIDDEHPEPVYAISDGDRLRELLQQAKDEASREQPRQWRSGMWLLRDDQRQMLRIGVGAQYGYLWWDDDASGWGEPALNPTPCDIEDAVFP